jgi:arylsulfatase
MDRPNILFVMTDQQRFDTIAALYEADGRLSSPWTATGGESSARPGHTAVRGRSPGPEGLTAIYTPNLDRLVARGVSFTNAYSTCPVCVPARYTIRTGREPPTTRVFTNGRSRPVSGQAETMEGRCGPYLPRTMHRRGYRTFGIGKSHTQPWNEDLGYEVHLHSEELYGTSAQRRQDAYAAWIAREHPSFDYIEALMGERTEMYYMPQVSPLPQELTVERWAADRAVEQIQAEDGRPYFGFVSFIGPHPPFAPPVPFNRMYDPDRMPDPVRGDLKTDHMDEQIPWMNHIIWAESINDPHARVLRARYYGEITYIDDCLGRILDAVDACADADNTVICFFSDHGDHLGDHAAWQKESFFDAACHVPFLISWPDQLPGGVRRDELVCLTDLFGLATGASGQAETRDGIDLLAILEGSAKGRSFLVGTYGEPGTRRFKIMVRDEMWKYIFVANGGGEQLFDMVNDPLELQNRVAEQEEVARSMRQRAVSAVDVPGAADALERGDLREFPYAERERRRIHQFDRSRGVTSFPERPQDVLGAWHRSGQVGA